MLVCRDVTLQTQFIVCSNDWSLSQGLPSPHHDAAGVPVSYHLPALHDETGETSVSYGPEWALN